MSKIKIFFIVASSIFSGLTAGLSLIGLLTMSMLTYALYIGDIQFSTPVYVLYGVLTGMTLVGSMIMGLSYYLFETRILKKDTDAGDVLTDKNS